MTNLVSPWGLLKSSIYLLWCLLCTFICSRCFLPATCLDQFQVTPIFYIGKPKNKNKKENQRTDQHCITLDHKVVHTGKCLQEKSTKDIKYSVCTMLLKVIPKSIVLSSFNPDGFSLWSGLCSFVLDILSAVMYLWLGLENGENSYRHFDEIWDE